MNLKYSSDAIQYQRVSFFNQFSLPSVSKINEKLFHLVFSAAMGNLRPAGRMRPFKLFSVALLEPLKYAYFIEKTTKSVEKSLFWPLTWHFSINLALEPIWVAHGCFSEINVGSWFLCFKWIFCTFCSLWGFSLE